MEVPRIHSARVLRDSECSTSYLLRWGAHKTTKGRNPEISLVIIHLSLARALYATLAERPTESRVRRRGAASTSVDLPADAAFLFPPMRPALRSLLDSRAAAL